MKAFYNTLIDIKDELMVRVYALIHIRKYREKAVRFALEFLSALVIICEMTYLGYGGKLGFLGIAGLIVFGTLFAYFILELFGRKKND